jgi:hypothetical protein
MEIVQMQGKAILLPKGVLCMTGLLPSIKEMLMRSTKTLLLAARVPQAVKVQITPRPAKECALLVGICLLVALTANTPTCALLTSLTTLPVLMTLC